MRLILFCSLFFLAACSTASEEAYRIARTKGAQSADKFFAHNLDQLCNWPTVGSVERTLKDNPYKYHNYKRLCGHSVY